MIPGYISEAFLQRFIQAALAEDIGEGDHSTLACIPASAHSKARLLVKEDGLLAGVELALRILTYVDTTLHITVHFQDGALVKKSDIAFTVEGPSRSILTAERILLNCMQRMSGIATQTFRLRKLIEGTHAQLLDTRKTTPNFRLLEKWAVLIGGGKNHRIGLFDMIMLKDNHIDMAGGIENAINRTKEYLRAHNKPLQVEIETRSLEEVKQVLKTGGVDIIMLDNMNLEDIRNAVKLIDGKFKTEASGGITEANLPGIAATGVDYISIGALTHSVKSLDLSLKVFS